MRSWLLLLFGFIASESLLIAEDNAGESAVSSWRREADGDFAFQGEYTGYQQPLGSARTGQLIGLHLVAQ